MTISISAKSSLYAIIDAWRVTSWLSAAIPEGSVRLNGAVR